LVLSQQRGQARQAARSRVAADAGVDHRRLLAFFTKALLEQLSTIRNIQSSTDLSDKLTSLVSQNEFAGASQLIGKAVSGVTQDNTRKLGIVSGVSKTSKGSVVILDDGSRIDFKNIDEVQDIADTSKKTTGAAA
jgi:flagellar hook assembly protein FlgD